VRSFGVTEGGLPELRTEVRASMERELEGAIRSRVRDQMFDALYRDNPMEVPQSMVEQQIQAMQQQMMRRTGTQDPAQLPGREAFQASARRRVALGPVDRRDRACAEPEGGSCARRRASGEHHRDPSGSAGGASAVPGEPRGHGAARVRRAGGSGARLAREQVKVVEQPSNFRALTGFGQTA
jgi:hypothetical protein